VPSVPVIRAPSRNEPALPFARSKRVCRSRASKRSASRCKTEQSITVGPRNHGNPDFPSKRLRGKVWPEEKCGSGQTRKGSRLCNGLRVRTGTAARDARVCVRNEICNKHEPPVGKAVEVHEN
jgi:hypothetical protein